MKYRCNEGRWEIKCLWHLVTVATVVITKIVAREKDQNNEGLLPNMNEKSESFYGNLKESLCPVAKGRYE